MFQIFYHPHSIPPHDPEERRSALLQSLPSITSEHQTVRRTVSSPALLQNTNDTSIKTRRSSLTVRFTSL
ncbi:hypothetical protein TNCT_89231 [Trichonephila clavata]|uniref:Uncharacterized protein n=1 Tax=Trichonephila clavata TaxID=2740835 RepID=A0A8X6F7T0_TRICU|nr:hypothetical protein TNCT_89231 [Trichonephila clavata]